MRGCCHIILHTDLALMKARLPIGMTMRIETVQQVRWLMNGPFVYKRHYDSKPIQTPKIYLVGISADFVRG